MIYMDRWEERSDTFGSCGTLIIFLICVSKLMLLQNTLIIHYGLLQLVKCFFLNVPEKIIAEKTGHISLAGLRAYEHTTHAQGAGNYKKSELFQCCLY